MIQHEFSVQSQVDRLGLSVLTGVPEDGEIRAVVQLVHGMAEMKERYIPFMEYLTLSDMPASFMITAVTESLSPQRLISVTCMVPEEELW
ncbi:MAG: hypothetical protein Q4B15_06765 [Lachnospiraceae bacterium]|nr:hypothetical protein [Lachnospiraceae bacterium]